MKWSNCTFIALIPKKINPQKVPNFRSISLVGCMYKVLSKVLANRLNRVMSKLIAETQSTFIKGRQIVDGILITNELVDEAKCRREDLLLFKVDFEKAYDLVEWDCLCLIMSKMNFPAMWRNWILERLSTTSMSVLVNGSSITEFQLGHGLLGGSYILFFASR